MVARADGENSALTAMRALDLVYRVIFLSFGASALSRTFSQISRTPNSVCADVDAGRIETSSAVAKAIIGNRTAHPPSGPQVKVCQGQIAIATVAAADHELAAVRCGARSI